MQQAITPWLLCWLFLPLIALYPVPLREEFLTWYELGTEASLVLLIALQINKTLRKRQPVDFRMVSLLGAFGSLLLADSVYNWRVAHNITTYDFLKCYGEAHYSLFMMFLVIAVLLHVCKEFQDKIFVVAAVSVFAVALTLNLVFIVLPFANRVPSFPLFSRIANPIYSFLSAMLTALTMPYVLRIRKYRSFYFFQAMLLLTASDFAIRYQSAFTGTNILSWAESGWAISVAGMAVLLFTSEGGDSIFGKYEDTSVWLSVRVLFALAVGFANVLLLMATLLINSFTVGNAIVLSSILLVLFGFWLISNLIAMRISSDLIRTSEIMFNPAAPAHASLEMPIPSISRRLLLYEMNSYIDRYNALAHRTNSLVKLAIEAAQHANLGKLSAQVAHDIRSPLAALDSILKNTATLPEEQRIMVRHAVNRIRDIANNLLEKNRQQEQSALVESHSREELVAQQPCLLSSVLDPVVTEKRLQFESKSGVTIDFELSQAAYGLFAKIHPVEFKRIISNLVNNSVEALADKGSVDIKLFRNSKDVLITVSDNGKGIPEEVLVKLGNRGETHGKTGGFGLGLFHARTTVETWGGSLHIESKQGKGTMVTIRLPEAQAPANFVSVLALSAGVSVVVLDDDTSIHQIWQGRFDSVRVKDHDIEVFHFSEPEGLRAWVKDFPDLSRKALYLFDYELLNYKETGLSLAGELGIAPRVILVTSRYEEKGVVEEAAKLNVRMIPKGLAGFVPIKVESRSVGNAAAVLVDDDLLVHMNWKVAARGAGIRLKAYKVPEEFNRDSEALAKNTPIYIDSELGNGFKGEDLAKELHEKGFIDITMATGHSPDNFSHFPWLKVRGKEPPWA